MKHYLLLLASTLIIPIAGAQMPVAGIVEMNFKEGRSQFIRQAGGKLIFIANSGNNFYTRRLFPFGAPDDEYNGIKTSRTKLTHLQNCKPFGTDIDKWGRLNITGSTRPEGTSGNIATLVRLTRDGTLDSSFGKGIIHINAGADGILCGAYLLSDDKTMVTGSSEVDGVGHFMLARLQYSGDPDKTFGKNGIMLDNRIPGNTRVIASAMLADNKFLLGGCNFTTDSASIVIARYNRDGTTDTTFGKGGFTITPARSFGYLIPRSMKLRPDGKIVVAGFCAGANNGRDLFVAQYMPNGSLDTSFGKTGHIKIDTFGIMPSTPMKYDNNLDALGVLENGDILLSGSTHRSGTTDVTRYLLYRIDSSGNLDKTFGYGTGKGLNMWPEKPEYQLLSNNIIIDPSDQKIFELKEELSERQSEAILSLSILVPDLRLGLIDIPDAKVQYNIYPKPIGASSEVTFDLVEQQNVTIKLTELNGKEIAILVNNTLYEEGENQFSLNFPPATKPGDYLLVLTTDGGYKLTVRITKKDKK